MSKQLIINLPARDITKSRNFFEALGFLVNTKLTDENATCFNIDEHMMIALLAPHHFKDAINNNEVADAIKTNEVLLSIGVASKTEVDMIAKKALAAGGTEIGKPTDFGAVYGTTFADLDGHQWNIFHMH